MLSSRMVVYMCMYMMYIIKRHLKELGIKNRLAFSWKINFTVNFFIFIPPKYAAELLTP